MNRFLGVDLGWYGKPTGLASIGLEDGVLQLRTIARLESTGEIVDWIREEAGSGSAVVAVDAPLVIRNASGIRVAESELNRDYRRFHAGCHAANLGRPFARNVIAFSLALEELGFANGPGMVARHAGRFQIEVHPHAASVSLFGLSRIVKYKRGTRAQRAAGLRHLRRLMLSLLPSLDPPLQFRLPGVPVKGPLKPVEDRIDAMFCAYLAAYWWHWGLKRNRVYGSSDGGYIVVPRNHTVISE